MQLLQQPFEDVPMNDQPAIKPPVFIIVDFLKSKKWSVWSKTEHSTVLRKKRSNGTFHIITLPHNISANLAHIQQVFYEIVSIYGEEFSLYVIREGAKMYEHLKKEGNDGQLSSF